MGPQELLDHRVGLVQLDSLGVQVLMVALVQPEELDGLDPKGLQGDLELQDLLDVLVLMDAREPLVSLDGQVQLEPLDQKV